MIRLPSLAFSVRVEIWGIRITSIFSCIKLIIWKAKQKEKMLYISMKITVSFFSDQIKVVCNKKKRERERDHSPGNRVLWSQCHNLKAGFKQRSDLKAFQVLSLLSKLPGSCLRSQGSWASRMLARLLWSSATNCSSPGKAEIKRTHLSDLVMHFHESLVINYKARVLKTWAEARQALLSDLSFAFKRCEYQRDPSLGLTGSTSSLPVSLFCVWGVGLGNQLS